MVPTGSHQDHQEALVASTNFRLLGETQQSNVLLRRNLAAVSGTPAAHFELHPDGTARALDDCDPGDWPIESISKERPTKDGRTEFQVVWAGKLPDYDKYGHWLPESDCKPCDIAQFRFDQRVKASKLSDDAGGITAGNTQPATRHTQSKVATGRVQKPHSGRRGNTKLRPDRISATKAVLSDSENDCKGEKISEEELAFYAARSAFRR
jgi:hypothetical protein